VTDAPDATVAYCPVFEVRSADPLSLAGAAAIFALVALAVCLAPARRAASFLVPLEGLERLPHDESPNLGALAHAGDTPFAKVNDKISHLIPLNYLPRLTRLRSLR
jgi:hypothetical protein